MSEQDMARDALIQAGREKGLSDNQIDQMLAKEGFEPAAHPVRRTSRSANVTARAAAAAAAAAAADGREIPLGSNGKARTEILRVLRQVNDTQRYMVNVVSGTGELEKMSDQEALDSLAVNCRRNARFLSQLAEVISDRADAIAGK